jgi:hypothetical protein
MNEKKDGKLRLNKVTIRDLETRLGKDEQKKVKGGTGNTLESITNRPIFC